ncbi:MAG: amidohydrolase family protein [Woeseiaceae bacterium]
MRRKVHHCCLLLACSLIFISSLVPPVGAQNLYDIVIANGRVMDPETGLDAVRNVGIRGEAVAAITRQSLDGQTVVDATGLVVSPGFIDLHAHGQSARANEFQAMDGVTTALELEAGVPDVGMFRAMREGDAIINYGASISHGALRTWSMSEHEADLDGLVERMQTESAVTDTLVTEFFAAISGGQYKELNPERYPVLWRRLEKGLQDGALGIGMPHAYYPGVSHDEIFRLFEFAADNETIIYTHVKGMGVSGVQEVVSNAVATGAALHIVHINSSSLWSYQTNLDIILGAQERGADLTTEAYPYTAASTGIESALFDDGWQDKMRISYGDVQWQDTGERLTEESFNEYRAKGGIVIIHLMKPAWIKAILSDPRVMVASDGMPYAPGAHPRSAGTFSRFLGRYVRDQELMSLMSGIAKMTLMPAQRLESISPQMKRKGRIQIGSDADITIFSEQQIIDTADFESELSYSEGVKYVLVNGQFVVWDGELVEGARPGRAILGRAAVF